MLIKANGEGVEELAMQGHPPCNLDSANLTITNDEAVRQFGEHDIIEKGEYLASHSEREIVADGVGNDNTSSRKQRVPKRCAKKSESLDSAVNGSGVTSKGTRRAPKLPLKRKICDVQSEPHQTSASHVDLLMFDGNDSGPVMKKSTPKLLPRRKIYIEQSEHRTSSACLGTVTSGQADDTSGGNILAAQIPGAIDSDLNTLDCFLHDDAEDMTLASFIKDKQLKRRLKPATNDDQGFKFASPWA